MVTTNDDAIKPAQQKSSEFSTKTDYNAHHASIEIEDTELMIIIHSKGSPCNPNGPHRIHLG